MENIAYLGRRGLETARQSDRDWFARNPHRTYRIRREIPGEFPNGRRHSIETTKWTVWTLVKELEPGVRLRVGFSVVRGAEPIDNDRSIEPLFNYAVNNQGARLIVKNSTAGEILMSAFLPPMQGVA